MAYGDGLVNGGRERFGSSKQIVPNMEDFHGVPKPPAIGRQPLNKTTLFRFRNDELCFAYNLETMRDRAKVYIKHSYQVGNCLSESAIIFDLWRHLAEQNGATSLPV